jgi:UDP-N-acetylmuramoylalanine--D-glutamate ligase
MDFRPDIAAVTNLYPEHVDWHGSVERYYRDKLHLIARDGDFAVALGAAAANNPLVLEALGDPGRLIPALSEAQKAAMDRAAATSRLKGEHNVDNARLAAAIALAAGATMAGIEDGIAAFRPLPHRLEEHRIGTTIFVDDSISTTPEATKAALAAYRGPRLALLAGGHERQQDYAELAGLLGAHGVTTLACLPVTGARLADAVRSVAPNIVVIEAPDLETAMQELHRQRQLFDVAILSPGAPSYNQFKNFEERGARFIALAEAIFG